MTPSRPRRRSGSSNRRRSRARRRPPVAVRRRRRQLGLVLLVVAAVVGFGYVNGGLGPLEDLLPEPAGGGQAGEGGGGQDRAGGRQPSNEQVEQASQRLAELPVAGWASMAGYERDRFPHWSEVDGCDVRERVLARDGERIERGDDSCEVRDGRWFSPFDGRTLTDSGEVDIDHLVPLANAWRTGASEWDEQRRRAFANDLDRPQLIAVSASSNRAKGDQDPSQWRPPERGYWCRYAHDWVAVKHYWQLSVTQAEKEALAGMLDTCD